jgi:hypothetical protein
MTKKNIQKKAGSQKARASRKGRAKSPVEFADGKDHLREETSEARSIESILQTRTAGPFETESISDFKDNLEGMTLTEMQELAVKAGVFPSGTKITLKSKLVKAFCQHSQGSMNVVQVTRPIVDPNSEQGKAFLRLTKGQ